MKGHRKEYRGLLYKDFMNLRCSFVVFAILLVILGAMFIPSSSFFALYIAMMILASLSVLSTIAMDNEAKWNSFVLTTAVSRKEIVRTKYILMILLSIPAWVLGILVYVLLRANFLPIDTEGLTAALVLISIATGLLHGSMMIPLWFKFDSPGIHYVSIILVILLGALAAFPYYLSMDAVGTALYPIAAGVVLGLFAVSIIAFGVSYLISQKIFAKKEF